MNTYIVNDENGATLGTIPANSVDEAREQAIFLYGPNITVVRQYDTRTIGFDPLWALLAILILAMYAKKKRS
jgi:hypothetical protein